jgi:hypothetical protein
MLSHQETQSKTFRHKADSHPGGDIMSGLGEFHHAEEAESKGAKITHWIIFAVVIAAMGAFYLAWS